MASIAVYSMKGGVGKSTLAVNLAWASATLSGRKTLLWDLDAQGASSFVIGSGKAPPAPARALFAKEIEPDTLIQPTAIPNLDLIAADPSLWKLDRFLFDLGRKNRLGKLIDTLGSRYERILLDCPPGLTEVSEQVLRAADLIVAPVIPSPLSQRALDAVVAFAGRQSGRHAPILPVYSMVDRRRALHRAALEARPDWPVLPMASAVEQMSTERAPLATFAPRSPAAEAFETLWRGIDKRIQQQHRSD